MADIDLLALLRGQFRVLEETRPKIGGVTLGIVTDTDDELGLGRVKVTMPWLSETVESAWARIAVPWAGQGMGSYFLPEVNDEVVLSFRHGDLANPYIIGFVWSAQSPPPQPSPRAGQRELRSKTGHKLQFDDLDGHRSVALHSSSGHTVTLDDRKDGPKVTIADANRNLSVTLDVTARTVTVLANGPSNAPGRIALRAPGGSIDLEADSVSIRASQVSLGTGQGEVKVSGNPIRLN